MYVAFVLSIIHYNYIFPSLYLTKVYIDKQATTNSIQIHSYYLNCYDDKCIGAFRKNSYFFFRCLFAEPEKPELLF